VAKAQAGAAVNRVFIAVADRCGVERGVDWFGGSVICDVTGYPLAGPAHGEPTTLLATVDLDQADDKRVSPYNDALTDRRTDLWKVAAEGTPTFGHRRVPVSAGVRDCAADPEVHTLG
jgi:predicted amidohydrolase